MSAAADPAAWLEQHAIRCERYRALLSPSACRQHQVVDPEACAKCPRLSEKDPGRRLRFRAVSARRARAKAIRDEERAMGARRKIVTCVDCGKEARNAGRGLCGACYSRHKRHGTLDRFEPLIEPPPAQPGTIRGTDTESAPAPATEPAEHPELVLRFTTERDQAVLRAVHRVAAEERRLPEAQAIHLLEAALRQIAERR